MEFVRGGKTCVGRTNVEGWTVGRGKMEGEDSVMARG